jgi:site-specific recombinase XerD
MNTLATTTDLILQTERVAIELVTNSLTSEHSKRAYSKALTDFFKWREENGNPPLTKATVQSYKQTLTGSPASINLKMSAIRKLALEASDNGLLDAQIANGVRNVSGVSSHGVRTGNGLTKQQAQQLLTAPNVETLKGLRDRAILAVMIGAGLRRSEVTSLTFDHIQQRDGRWVIVDIVGKANHLRTIPIPSWVKLAIDEWTTSANIHSDLIFRAIHKGGYIKHESITPQAIRDIVKEYGTQIGMSELAAHDLRRTFAKLAHKGGSGLDQIQLSLGHLSIKTTEKYLGVSQNLTDAPCDHLGLSLE